MRSGWQIHGYWKSNHMMFHHLEDVPPSGRCSILLEHLFSMRKLVHLVAAMVVGRGTLRKWVLESEFKPKLTYGDLALSSKVGAPSASCLYQRWSVWAKRNVTQEVHLRTVKCSGGLGVPQALSWAGGFSLQPDWPLDPCPTLCSELKKKKDSCAI